MPGCVTHNGIWKHSVTLTTNFIVIVVSRRECGAALAATWVYGETIQWQGSESAFPFDVVIYGVLHAWCPLASVYAG